MERPDIVACVELLEDSVADFIDAEGTMCCGAFLCCCRCYLSRLQKIVLGAEDKGVKGQE
jgi:hypothetical protein